MNTIYKKTILSLLIFTSLVSVGFLSFHPSKIFAADCTATAEFRPSGEQAELWFNDGTRPVVFVDVKTENCAGKTIEMSITERDTTGNDDIAELDNKRIKVLTSESFTLIMKAGETECETGAGADCHYFIQIYATSDGAAESYDSLGAPKGELSYECDVSCFTDWIFMGVTTYGASSFPDPVGNVGICKIFSARFSPFGDHGADAEFYKESDKPPVTINILTENCGGKKIYVTLMEYDAPLKEISLGLGQTRALSVPSNNSLKINLKAGEAGCSSIYDPDCKYAIWVGSEESLQYVIANYPDCVTVICMLQLALVNVPGFYYSQSKPQGDLQYDCDGLCQDTDVWSFISSEQGEGGVENGQQVIPTNAGTGTTSTYQLLAPVPGITSVDVSKENALADYLGIIFKLIIGITGVLSVLMIVLGGIEYMTSDVIFDKEAAKKRIWNAILGLLLALGSYAILNTLNPDLLKINLNAPDATIELTADEKVFSQTEESVSLVAQGYRMNGTFANPSPSSGVAAFKILLDQYGYTLDEIRVNTSAKTATFKAVKGAVSQEVTVPVNLGKNGVSEIGQAVEGDGKTPKGTSYITSDRRISTGTDKAVFTRDGKFNMGAAFINTGATTLEGKDRGIGFHSNSTNDITKKTNGCIRMHNDDLVVLAPYMRTGLKVIIE